MCASRLLIVGLMTITGIESAQISSKSQHHLRSPHLRYPTVPRSPLRDNSPPTQFYIASNNNLKIIDSKLHPYNRKKKFNPWIDRNKLKRPKWSEKSKYGKMPKNIYSNDLNEGNGGTNKFHYSNSPSVHLEPPKFNDADDYDYYSKSKKPVLDNGNVKNGKEAVGSLKNHRLQGNDEDNEDNSATNYVRDHAPELQVESSDDVKTTDSEESSYENAIGTSESPKDRIEFHIHGHEGPQTYIFGYDTGDGDNRQFRLEERHEDGSVTGQYGYIDARGKLRKVRYKASPTEGYVEKHHETKK